MKRNQIMITTFAVMIAAAGYLTFTGKGSAEETVVVADEIMMDDEMSLLDLSEEDLMAEEAREEESYGEMSLEDEGELTDNYLEETMEQEVASNDVIVDLSGSDEEEMTEDVVGEAVFTNSNAISTLSAAKLLKEQTRAMNREALSEIVSNDVLEASQKEDALAQMVALTEKSEKEMETEILLSSKGFTEAVVSIGDDSVDVVVCIENLSDAHLAQIMDIVSRKTEIPAEQIIISQVTQK